MLHTFCNTPLIVLLMQIFSYTSGKTFKHSVSFPVLSKISHKIQYTTSLSKMQAEVRKVHKEVAFVQIYRNFARMFRRKAPAYFNKNRAHKGRFRVCPPHPNSFFTFLNKARQFFGTALFCRNLTKNLAFAILNILISVSCGTKVYLFDN